MTFAIKYNIAMNSSFGLPERIYLNKPEHIRSAEPTTAKIWYIAIFIMLLLSLFYLKSAMTYIAFVYGHLVTRLYESHIIAAALRTFNC